MIADTDYNAMLGVAWCSARSENKCGAERECMPSDDLEFADVDLTRVQIERILPQFRLLRQRFLLMKHHGLSRFLPRPIAYAPAHTVFRENGPPPHTVNPFRP